MLRVILRITKGIKNWNHPVQISHDPSVHERMSLVYWMQKFLVNRGIDLNNQALLAKHAQEKLWHWNADAMREIFADRVYRAGFDKGYFSFHSLRSGFLCSALLKAADSLEVEAVLEHTAMVAGWKVGGSA